MSGSWRDRGGSTRESIRDSQTTNGARSLEVMHRVALLALSIQLLAGPICAQASTVLRGEGYAGKLLPELDARGGTWLGAGGAVRLEQLTGAPVLVLFTVLW